MSATKLDLIYGLTMRAESTYGTLPTFDAATDGVQPAEQPEVTLNYASDGARPTAPGRLSPQRRAAPSGRTAAVAFSVEGKGLGSAYSGSALPPNVDVALRACGLTRAFAAGAHTYTAGDAVTGLTSAGLQVFTRGERFDIRGAYGTMSFEAASAQPGRFRFEFQGLCNDPADDTSAASITYPALTVDPPKAENIAVTIGSFTAAVVRSVRCTQNREISPRLNVNGAGGHAGFSPGRRSVQWEIVAEATALVGSPFHTTAGIDPYRMILPAFPAAPVVVPVSVTVGNTATNRYSLSSASAQLINAVPSADGPTALWTLTLQAVETNDLVVVFN